MGRAHAQMVVSITLVPRVIMAATRGLHVLEVSQAPVARQLATEVLGELHAAPFCQELEQEVDARIR